MAPPTPALLVRLCAVLLRTDPALALTGRRPVPARLLARDLQFAHPDLDEALADLQTRRSKAGLTARQTRLWRPRSTTLTSAPCDDVPATKV